MVPLVEGLDVVHVTLAVGLDAATLGPAHRGLQDHRVVDVTVLTVVGGWPYCSGSVGPRVEEGVHLLWLGLVVVEL